MARREPGDLEMDPLSQVLRSLHLRGSVSLSWELGAPWGISLDQSEDAPFHFVESGACVLVTRDGEPVDLASGDIVVLFDGKGHRLCDAPGTRAEPLQRILASQPETAAPLRYGGRGSTCRLICGRFTVDERESAPATLRHLPSLVHIPRQSSDRVRSFAMALDLLSAETRRPESGSERAASILTEMLLIHVIRHVLAEQRQPAGRGWVEGLRDPRIGAALAAIHGEPERPWSVDALAARAGVCRSIFATRFAQRVGSTPMSYLARWRLQIAARLLRETTLTVSEIFQRLGYGSAPSFDRAFKRVHQVSPSAYRRAPAFRVGPSLEQSSRTAESTTPFKTARG